MTNSIDSFDITDHGHILLFDWQVKNFFSYFRTITRERRKLAPF